MQSTMGLLQMIKSCFCPEDIAPQNTHWKKATLLLLVNSYELDYEIKDHNGEVLADCPIEDFDEKKHNVSFTGEQYYKRLLSKM